MLPSSALILNGSEMPRLLIFSTDIDHYGEQLLCGLSDIGYEIFLVLDPHRKSPPDRWNPKLKLAAEVELKGRFDQQATEAYAAQIKRLQPDLCLCYTSRALAIALRARALTGLETPLVGTRGAVGGISSWHPQDWFTYLHPKLDSVICFSDAIRKRLEHEARRFWPGHPGKFVTIHQGYSTLVASATKRDHASRANSQTKVMMTIANERPIKGVKLLLDALENHVSANNWQLMLIGQLSDATQQRIKSSSRLKDRVICTGFRIDARSLLATGDLYIQPTLSPGEGIGNAIAEAMAAELPVVTSNVGGALELVQSISPELLFSANDAGSLGKTLDLALSELNHEGIGPRSTEVLLTKFALSTEVENYRQLFDRIGFAEMPDS